MSTPNWLIALNRQAAVERAIAHHLAVARDAASRPAMLTAMRTIGRLIAEESALHRDTAETARWIAHLQHRTGMRLAEVELAVAAHRCAAPTRPIRLPTPPPSALLN